MARSVTVISILVRVVINAVALWVATFLPGIELGGDTTAQKVGTLLAVAVIFGIVNGVIKPIIKTIGCAFYIVTLGLVALVVNALLFMLVGWLAGQLDLAFTVDDFWAGLLGAIVVALVSFLISIVVPDKYDR